MKSSLTRARTTFLGREKEKGVSLSVFQSFCHPFRLRNWHAHGQNDVEWKKEETQTAKRDGKDFRFRWKTPWRRRRRVLERVSIELVSGSTTTLKEGGSGLREFHTLLSFLSTDAAPKVINRWRRRQSPRNSLCQPVYNNEGETKYL